MNTNKTPSGGTVAGLSVAGGSAHWPCECRNWCRCEPIDLKRPMPNHHHACQHYNASLIDVWRVQTPGDAGGLIVDDEAVARQVAAEDPDAPLEVTKERMHSECLEQLGEFAGW